jgi:hypothetical protein
MVQVGLQNYKALLGRVDSMSGIFVEMIHTL